MPNLAFESIQEKQDAQLALADYIKSARRCLQGVERFTNLSEKDREHMREFWRNRIKTLETLIRAVEIIPVDPPGPDR